MAAAEEDEGAEIEELEVSSGAVAGAEEEEPEVSSKAIGDVDVEEPEASETFGGNCTWLRQAIVVQFADRQLRFCNDGAGHQAHNKSENSEAVLPDHG